MERTRTREQMCLDAIRKMDLTDLFGPPVKMRMNKIVARPRVLKPKSTTPKIKKERNLEQIWKTTLNQPTCSVETLFTHFTSNPSLFTRPFEMSYGLVPGFENVVAMEDGSIWEYRDNQWTRKQTSQSSGYIKVSIGLSHPLHRMLALTFLENPHNYPIVRHLNDCPNDNTLLNLCWGTQGDNITDAWINNRINKQRKS